MVCFSGGDATAHRWTERSVGGWEPLQQESAHFCEVFRQVRVFEGAGEVCSCPGRISESAFQIGCEVFRPCLFDGGEAVVCDGGLEEAQGFGLVERLELRCSLQPLHGVGLSWGHGPQCLVRCKMCISPSG